ncbi:MAG: lipopolysaccharide biosynthesis protein [Comamonas sp.]|nr:lipopolysaccharide biosynthesis protein [Candidatus Comamonas equi]
MNNPELDQIAADDEIDLMDMLVVVAENIKLLVMAPILIGLIAWGIAFLIPKSFESQALLSTNKPGLNVSSQVLASYIKSADILEKVAKEAGFGSHLGPAALQAEMQQLVKVSVGKQDQLISLTTKAETPEAAQALNFLVWKHVLPLTQPRGSEKKYLQEQLESEQERLSASRALELLTAQRLEQGNTSESAGRLYGELLSANSARTERIASLQSSLEGLMLDSLAQQPTISELPVSPKKSLIALVSALSSGMILLIFVFVRHGFRSAQKSPQQAQKIERMRAAFRR